MGQRQVATAGYLGNVLLSVQFISIQNLQLRTHAQRAECIQGVRNTAGDYAVYNGLRLNLSTR
jgi:hypothetical protein